MAKGRFQSRVRGPALRRCALLLLSGALVGGCSTGSWISSSTSNVTDFFSGGGSSRPTNVAAAGGPASTPEFDCPGVTIRDGASTLAVNAPNADPSAVNLRYQAIFTQTARECRVNGPTVGMKVGMQGRVILGPFGGPGQVDIPLRYAVVREGVQPKTVWSKLHRVKVDLPPGQANVAFTHIIDDIAFPMPPGAEIDAYVVYVGYDPNAAAEDDKRNRRPQQKPPRQKQQPTAMRMQ